MRFLLIALLALAFAGCCDLAIPVKVCDGNAVPAAVTADECGPVYPGQACLPTAPFDEAQKAVQTALGCPDNLHCDMETP